jgi:uncharacterized protein involved in response to NO
MWPFEGLRDGNGSRTAASTCRAMPGVGMGFGWVGWTTTSSGVSGFGAGRIIPSFTRNWLAKRGPGPLPASFGLFDKLTLAGTGLALALWAALPHDGAAGAALLLAAALQCVRMARWCGLRTLAEPLVWVLHLAYAWLPVGLGLLGIAAFGASFRPPWPSTH